jgi:hypothetical protein
VRAWSLDSLATFAEQDAGLLPLVKRALEGFERSGAKLSKRGPDISERGFRLDASRREAVWLEMNNGSVDANVSSLAIENPHLVFVVACAGHGRWRHGLLNTSNVCR